MIPAVTVVPGERTVSNKSKVILEICQIERRTIVTTPSHKHYTSLGNLAVNLEVVQSLLWSSNVLSTLIFGNSGRTVGVLGVDLAVSVDDVWRVDGEQLLAGIVARKTVAVRKLVNLCVWCHLV